MSCFRSCLNIALLLFFLFFSSMSKPKKGRGGAGVRRERSLKENELDQKNHFVFCFLFNEQYT